MSGWCNGNAVGEPQQYVSDADCEDCVEKIKTYKTIQFPCSQNIRQNVTRKVPRQVKKTRQVPVNYVEHETRAVVQPVTKFVNVTSYKDVPRQVPVTKSRTAIREKTRTHQVPVVKWVDVEVKFQEPKTEEYVEHETQYERRPIVTAKPVVQNVTKYVNIPTTKQRLEERTVYETVMEDQTEQVCEPVKKMCTTVVPVYKLVVRPPGQCNSPLVESEFDKLDPNVDTAKIEIPEEQRRASRSQQPRRNGRTRAVGNWQ